MTNDDANAVKPTTFRDKQELWERLAKLRYTMMTTHDADGAMQARPVTTLKIEPEGRMWFFVALSGGIAEDIERDPTVHLSFMDTDDDLFVSLLGHASLKRDPNRARELWSTMAGSWFPGGPDDPNLGVLSVDVHRGDYWVVLAS